MGAEVDLPYRIDKPWGYELVWAKTDRYVGKILHIRKGHLLSLQYHEKKDETIYVLSGEITFLLRTGDDKRELRMKAGDCCHVPPRTIHRVEAHVDADLLEASTPEIDDVIRLEDRYGRIS